MSILSVMIGSGHELIRRKAEILFGCREQAVGANTFFAPTEKTTSQPTEAQTREQHSSPPL